ncbi:hypothetical protein BDK51DRAFT_48501 [Blyttiomyces helicus]|uniref:Uncharacterized protein n=1 Tax=Blyttiomyces helicus TaxID=388810 RepID=A0A4P9W2D3_9FUNG|nr:hypothetical protein BDK51DRAFT_48501 [Blyttiomyces helicus]|eukprot:RKO84938.1 hypothetical protein BDK51DRAFT_48501 [Blyttiomyces helicus]
MLAELEACLTWRKVALAVGGVCVTRKFATSIDFGGVSSLGFTFASHSTCSLVVYSSASPIPPPSSTLKTPVPSFLFFPPPTPPLSPSLHDAFRVLTGALIEASRFEDAMTPQPHRDPDHTLLTSPKSRPFQLPPALASSIRALRRRLANIKLPRLTVPSLRRSNWTLTIPFSRGTRIGPAPMYAIIHSDGRDQKDIRMRKPEIMRPLTVLMKPNVAEAESESYTLHAQARDHAPADGAHEAQRRGGRPNVAEAESESYTLHAQARDHAPADGAHEAQRRGGRV